MNVDNDLLLREVDVVLVTGDPRIRVWDVETVGLSGHVVLKRDRSRLGVQVYSRAEQPPETSFRFSLALKTSFD